MAFCGLDFGTSNTTIGVFADGAPRLLPIEGNHRTIPSAVFYGVDEGEEYIVGRSAVEKYLERSEGRFMRALKSILGTSLMADSTRVPRRTVRFSDIIGEFLSEVRTRASAAVNHPLDQVVLGRPVKFGSGAPKLEAEAQQLLLSAANTAGFTQVSFEYEPVAAALDYEQQVTSEILALVADIGGGTSDFSIVRLGADRRRLFDRRCDVLASTGLRLGGTDIDKSLSLDHVMPSFGYRSLMIDKPIDVPSSYYFDMSTWSRVNQLYANRVSSEIKQIMYKAQKPELLSRLLKTIEARRCHHVLTGVEEAKINLSQLGSTELEVDWIDDTFAVGITREALEESIQDISNRIMRCADQCLSDAGVSRTAVGAIFLTGGTSSIPLIRNTLNRGFPSAEMIEGDKFGSVGVGLTIAARARFR